MRSIYDIDRQIENIKVGVETVILLNNSDIDVKNKEKIKKLLYELILYDVKPVRKPRVKTLL